MSIGATLVQMGMVTEPQVLQTVAAAEAALALDQLIQLLAGLHLVQLPLYLL
jgi:hypothetical protein